MTPLSKQDFSKLLNLGLEFEWLCNREAALLEMWVEAGQDSNKKKLIEYLIRHFLYVDSNKASQFCDEIANHVVNEWKLKAENTFLVATCDNSRPDGSQVIVQKLKNRFPDDWREFDFINSIVKAAYLLNSHDNIILCDDFIGTGETMNRKINYLIKTFKKRAVEDVHIFIIAFAAMNFSLCTLSNYPIYVCEKLPKGLTDTLTGNNLLIATKIMEDLESSLKPKIRKRYLPHFGYKKSESLFNFEDDNIPNNVFPIFWWNRYVDNKKRQTMFKRV